MRRLFDGAGARRPLIVGFATVLAIVISPAVGSASAASPGPAVQTVLTTADMTKALTDMPPMHFAPVAEPGVPVLHVDDRARYQRMIGFGAAMTDSSAWLLYDQLSRPAARAQAMSALFSAAGIHLDLTLVPMAASDFTVGGVPYSYDDLAAGQTDPTLAHFSVAHDLAYIIPALQQMLRVNPAENLIATPWSPPPWMKANQSFDDSGYQGAVLTSDYPPLAQYFVKFIRAYRRSHIPIWAVAPQNEPSAGSQFPSALMQPQDEARFVSRNLAPALSAAGLHPRIYGGDGGGAGGIAYVQSLLQAQPAGAGALNGIAWHCYGGEEALGTIHQSDPNLQQIVTECSPGIIPYTAAEAAISAAHNWASALLLWNLALDPTGGPVQPPNSGCARCTGLLQISERTHTVRYSLNYYQLGQLSKFVLPGAVRVGTQRWVSDFDGAPSYPTYGVTSGLDNVAFENPNGTRVLVAYNHSPSASRFAVSWRGQAFAYTLAPGATVTFSWK